MFLSPLTHLLTLIFKINWSEDPFNIAAVLRLEVDERKWQLKRKSKRKAYHILFPSFKAQTPISYSILNTSVNPRISHYIKSDTLWVYGLRYMLCFVYNVIFFFKQNRQVVETSIISVVQTQWDFLQWLCVYKFDYFKYLL